MHIIEENILSHKFISEVLFKATQWKMNVKCTS